MDLSNVQIGAKSGPEPHGINAQALSELVEGRHPAEVCTRWIIASVPKTLEQERIRLGSETFEDWKKLGYGVIEQERRGGSEQGLDNCLVVSVLNKVIARLFSKL